MTVIPGEMVIAAHNAHQVERVSTPHERMELALEAVLPMVRERLATEAGDPCWGLTEGAHDDFCSIFDAAFAEEDQ